MIGNADGASQGYVVCIGPWAARRSKCNDQGSLHLPDECALIQAVNPLLPCGLDVRDVLGHVESKGGFFYLIDLTTEQARQLGWKE